MFVSRDIRSSVTAGRPIGDPALADLFGLSGISSSGHSVTAESAMRVSAVYACIRVLAETLASTPIVLYRRLGDGSKERAVKHRLYQLVHRQPNRWQTNFEWREMGMAHLCLRGVAYSRIVANNAGISELVPMHPDHVRAEQRDDGRLVYEYSPPNGARQVLLQDEVLRVPFMTVKGINPVTPIEAQRDNIGEALGSQDYASRFLRNDATPRSYIQMEGAFKDKEDKKKFRDSWHEAQSGENRHKTAVLERGMKLETVGMSNQDAQFLELREFKVSDIARIWRVPPHLIGDLKRSTFSNIEQQALEFVKYTMAPWYARWEQALSRDLLSEAEQEEYFFEHLVEGLLRGDILTRYRAYAVGRQWGWLSANDIRDKETENRITDGDTYLSPTNMVPARQVGDPGKTDPEQGKGAADEQGK